MPNLSLIVRKIKSIEATSKITDSLKIVSSNKLIVYKSLQKKTKSYTWGINKLFKEFFYSPEHFYAETNKQLIKNQSGPTLWIVVGTDIGMCGDYNNKIASFIKSNVSPVDYLFVLGNKLFNTIKEDFESQIIYNSTSEIQPSKIIDQIEEISRKILTNFRSKKAGRLSLVYLKNKQAGLIEKLNILPFNENYFSEKRPIYIKSSEYRVDHFRIITQLFPKYLETLLTNSIISSKISEHSSRSDLMYTATKNANELLDEYKIKFNKMRQSIITQEISEIVAAVQTKK